MPTYSQTMFQCFLLGLCMLCMVNGESSRTTLEQDRLDFTERILKISEMIERDPMLQAEWDARVALDDSRAIEAEPAEFTCDVSKVSTEVPTSVHKLRPSDIKVIAAFGDSITAGNGLGARRPIEVAVENRGESWAIGGDRSLEEGVITVPNILRKFNPRLMGYSQCWSFEDSDRSWFNVARPGARADDMLQEARMLVRLMKADKRVDYDNDWKLLTLFIGGNDLCVACHGKINDDVYYDYIDETLEYLKAEMPRVMINLVSMFDVTPLQNMTTGLLCDLLQWGFCDCARNWTTIPMLRPMQLLYSERLESLANDSRFQSEDFTVIWQPQMQDLLPPVDPSTGKYELGFLSPDCFHPTRISHQGFAVWLWNAMLTPVGQKRTTEDSSDYSIPIECPNEVNPYIFTNENSIGAQWPVPTVPMTARPTLRTVGSAFNL